MIISFYVNEKLGPGRTFLFFRSKQLPLLTLQTMFARNKMTLE